MSTRRGITGLLILIMLLAFRSGANSPAAAQPAGRFFPETGHTVAGRFLAYWDAHGGLDQQGYPLSDELSERAANGQPHTVQYFERAVFELHPEYAGSPYEVLLARLGADEYRERYGPGGAPNPQPNATDPRAFPETGHTIGGLFRAYWEAHGGLEQQGYPLSDEFTEISPLDGQLYRVQYFERAVFEYHSEHVGTPYVVLLAQLGRYVYEAKQRPLVIPPPLDGRANQFNPVGSDKYLVWGEIVQLWPNPPPAPRYTVVALNLYTRQAMTVTNAIGSLALSDSLLVWSDRQPGCATCDLDLFAKDLLTGESYTVATGPGSQVSPSVLGHIVSWLDVDTQSTQIMLKDLDTGVTQVLTRTQGFIPYFNAPLLSADYIAWADVSASLGTNRSDYDVRVYNRHTAVIQTVAHGINTTIPYLQIALTDHYLAWSDNSVHLLDLQTGRMDRLYHKFASGLSGYGDLLFWTVGTSNGQIPAFVITQLKDRTARWLVPGSDDNWRPTSVVAGGWLVGYEENRLSARRLDDLRAATQPLPPVPSPNPPFIADSLLQPPESDGVSIFWRSAGTNTVIYRYQPNQRALAVVNEEPGQKLALTSDGQMVAWVESQLDGRYRIRGQSLAANTVWTLREASDRLEQFGSLNQYPPGRIALDRGVLYYQSTAPGHEGLWAYTLATGAEELINPTGYDPIASNGHLLWREQRTEPARFGPVLVDYLHLRPGDNPGEDIVIEKIERQPDFGYAALSEDNVVWSNVNEGIQLFHIPDRHRQALTAPPKLPYLTPRHPLIRGNTVVWAEPQEQGGRAYKAYDLVSGNTTTIGPPPSTSGEAWAILDSGQLVYWEHAPGESTYNLYGIPLPPLPLPTYTEVLENSDPLLHPCQTLSNMV